jgi:phosphomannomutase
LAARFGCPVHRSKIGEANVAGEMLRWRAVVGGEGNGGVIYPRINFARDSLVGMALVLHLLAGDGRAVSEILAGLPRTYMFKEKLACRSDKIGRALKTVREAYARWPQDTRDGVKVTTPDGWFLVRGSNTEPIIRLFAEAADEAQARALIEDLRRRVGECMGD